MKETFACNSPALVDDNLEGLCSSHTPAPSGYIAWHRWAKKMGKTHKQLKCKGCGLFKVWVLRANK